MLQSIIDDFFLHGNYGLLYSIYEVSMGGARQARQGLFFNFPRTTP